MSGKQEKGGVKMQIGPEEMDVVLPRALFGGLKQAPTEELLHRIAQEYELLYDEEQEAAGGNRPVRASRRRGGRSLPDPIPGRPESTGEDRSERGRSSRRADFLDAS